MKIAITYFSILILPFATTCVAQETATAQKGKLDVTVNLPGVFVADNKDEIKMEPKKYSGDLIITRIVNEGAFVKKGDVLIEFETDKVEEKIEEAQNEATDAEVELKKAEAELNSAKIELETKTAASNVELQHLKRDVEAAIEKQLMEMTSKEKGISDSEYALKQQLVDLETLKQIYEEREVETSSGAGDILINRELASIESRKKGIAFQKRQLEYFEKFDKSKDQLDKELEVIKKEAEIKKQAINLEASVVEKQAVVDKAKRKLATAQKKVDGLVADKDNLQVISPRDGVIFYGQTGRELPAGVIVSHSGSDPKKQLRIGGRVKTHRILLTVASMDRLSIKMTVDEGDIQNLEEGLSATIYPDAFPNQNFDGEITKVDLFATRTGFTSDSRTFKVMARCTQDAPELRSGMNCRVAIHCKSGDDAVLLPIRSIFVENGELVCFLKTGNGYEQQTVKVGGSNADFVHVTDGINEGDEVYLSKPKSDSLNKER